MAEEPSAAGLSWLAVIRAGRPLAEWPIVSLALCDAPATAGLLRQLSRPAEVVVPYAAIFGRWSRLTSALCRGQQSGWTRSDSLGKVILRNVRRRPPAGPWKLAALLGSPGPAGGAWGRSGWPRYSAERPTVPPSRRRFLPDRGGRWRPGWRERYSRRLQFLVRRR